LSKDPYR